MEITPTNVVPYLLSRGALTPAAIMDGELVVRPASRRNRNLRISHPRRGLFVKQAQVADAAATLRREAMCYRRAHTEPRLAALRRLLPSFVDYDAARHVLVVELIEPSETIQDCFARERAFPEELGALLADALAVVQSDAGRRCRGEADDETFPAALPWLMTANGSPAALARWLGPAAASLMTALLRDAAFTSALQRVAATWRRDTLIHGDLKWDNCLLVPETDGTRSLRLVDWELADIGDGRWDIAGVVGALLMSWISWSSWTRERGGRELPMTSTLPALQSFWRRLLVALAVPASEREVLREQVIIRAALRVLQSALEMCQRQQTPPRAALAASEYALALLRAPSGGRALLSPSS